MTEQQTKKGFFSRFKKSDKKTEQSQELTGALAQDSINTENSGSLEKHTDSVVEQNDSGTQGETVEKQRFLKRMKSGLSKTRQAMSSGFGTLLLGRREIDDELFEDLEMQLVMSDVGVDATRQVIDNLEQRVERQEMADGNALVRSLQNELTNILEPCQTPLDVDSVQDGPFVVLVVGVNGVGKTTTIGKLAKYYQQQGKSVMLAAGDTFRAAAVEQLQVWGERNDVPVIAQHTGADSASVIFDAVQAAKARNTDIIIADTAGRLHNKSNLMDELSKVVRVMQKLDATAPHEVLLVLDAATGQNALNQAEHFRKAVGVTGVALTKLDGTAKGGVIFAIAKQLGLPIRFIGVGEQIDDLRPFKSEDFVEALFEDLEI